nr:NTP transferase domain-containing protein [Paenibacillus protaetiae]
MGKPKLNLELADGVTLGSLALHALSVNASSTAGLPDAVIPTAAHSGCTAGSSVLSAGAPSVNSLSDLIIVARPDDDMRWLPSIYRNGIYSCQTNTYPQLGVKLHKSVSYMGDIDAELLLPQYASVRIIRCPDAHLGMSHSIRSGLAAAAEGQPDAVLIALADQPFIPHRHIEMLIEAFNDSGAHFAATANREGIAMPPAIFGRRLFPALERLEGDAGARKLLSDASNAGVFVPALKDEWLMDIDDPDSFKLAADLYSKSMQIPDS